MAVNGTNSKIDSKMEKVISALLTSRTVEEASRVSGVGAHTIYRWLKLKEFDEAYKEAKRQIVSHAITQIQSATSEAVQVLRGIMNDIEVPASSRVSSAKIIIEMAIKSVELEEVVRRVEELEKIVEERGA